MYTFYAAVCHEGKEHFYIADKVSACLLGAMK